MNNVNHRDLDLSFIQNLTLCKIKYCGIDRYAVQITEKYSYLIEYNLVVVSRKNPNRFKLSNTGKMYLRYKFRSFFVFWIPVFISIIALFGGYDVYTNPLLKKLLEATALFLKTIMGNLDIVL